MSLDIHLTIYPTPVIIFSIHNDIFPNATYHLLQLLFFTEREDRLINITRTEEEVSIIADQDSFELLPKSCISEKCEFAWCAIELALGDVIGEQGTAEKISGPLAQAGITIFYVSTYDSDYLLVPENKLDEAIEVLLKHFSSHIEGLGEYKPSTLPPFPTFPLSDSILSTSPSSKKIQILPCQLLLCKFDYQILNSVGIPLIKALFFPSSKSSQKKNFKFNRLNYFSSSNPKFFSLTQAQGVVNLIVNKDVISSFPVDSFPISIVDMEWTALRISEDNPLGFVETGIVFSLSKPLSSANIPIYYLSTFLTDITLVILLISTFILPIIDYHYFYLDS